MENKSTSRRFRFTIKRKLLLISMMTTLTALIVACVALLMYDQITFKQKMVDDLSTLAEIIGNNSTAAITFNDKQAAAEVLASLKAKPQISLAEIYLTDGSCFASTNPHNADKVEEEAENDANDIKNAQREVGPRSYHFTRDYLDMFKSIQFQGKVIGGVAMHQSLVELTQRFQRNAAAAGLILLLSGILAYIISALLGRMISRPILHLAEIANRVSLDKNYSLRASRMTHDELGILTGRFNEMLSQIDERDSALVKTQAVLKREIEEKNNEILERLKTQHELDLANEELKKSNNDLQQFAHVASHDLQEPLRTVASYVQLLERRYKDQLDDEAKKFIDFAVAGAVRMQKMIKDLLIYSRVSTKGNEFKRTNCEEILRLSLMNLKVAIEESQAQVTHDPLPELKADGAQLIQLFQNLIGNALKFHIPDQLPQIHISAVPSDEGWKISVKDNGIGIEQQYFDRIFVIFQRLHNRQKYPGTGLGLAVCARIVERHGGRIWVESQPGEGTEFFFTIPTQKCEASNERKEELQPCEDLVG
jgi:signal transduction histidine kinase